MFIVFEQNPQLYSATDMFRLFEDPKDALGHAAGRGFLFKPAGLNSNDAAGLQEFYNRTGQKVVSCATGPGASVYVIEADVKVGPTTDLKGLLAASSEAIKELEGKLEAADKNNIDLQAKLGSQQAVIDGLESKLKVLQNQ